MTFMKIIKNKTDLLKQIIKKKICPLWDTISAWTWEIIQTLAGLIVIFAYRAVYVKNIGKRCLYVSNSMPGGISLGKCIIVGKSSLDSDICHHHEYGHTRQSMMLGPFYIFIVGICSILNATFDFAHYYYDFWTEKWADKLGGITRKPGTNIRYIAKDTIIK